VAAGRCAGCTKVAPVPAIRIHVVDCPAWQKLYAADPARALEPVAEYQRWLDEDKDDERDQHRERAVAETAERRAAGTVRFAKPKDILDDD
jgi:hypothetical protein